MLWLWPWASSRDPVLCSALTPGPSLWGQTVIPGRLVPATGVKLLVGAPSECLIPVSTLTRLSQHPGRQQAILGSSTPARETQVEFWPPGSGLVQPLLLLLPGSELVEGRPLSMSLQNKMKISRKLKSRNAFRKTWFAVIQLWNMNCREEFRDGWIWRHLPWTRRKAKNPCCLIPFMRLCTGYQGLGEEGMAVTNKGEIYLGLMKMLCIDTVVMVADLCQ